MNYLQIVLPVLALLAVALMNFAVMPALRRHRAEEAVTAEWERGKERKPEVRAAPEPREPRDKDRTYPRPKGSRSKLNRVCPVCGTGQETTALDGRVLGWPAHQTCAEWLGDWRPRRPPPPPYKPDPELIGYAEKGQKQPEQAALWNGLATVDEMRQRLLSTIAIPPPDTGKWPLSIGPLPSFQRYRCECGMEFQGAGPDLERSLEVHRTSGQCEQRRKFRGDPGPIEVA